MSFLENVSTRVNIVFDDKFKIFIKKLQERLNDELECLQEYILNKIIIGTEEIQYKIREYIIKHQDEFNYEKKNKITETNHSNTDFFAIFVCLLVNIDTCDNFNDVWIHVRKHHKLTEASTEKEEGTYENYKCACSQICSVDNLYIISNDILRRSIMVGSVCIQKNYIIDSTEIKKLISERKKRIQEKKEKQEREQRIKQKLVDREHRIKQKLIEAIPKYIEEKKKKVLNIVINILKANLIKNCIMCKNQIDKTVYFKKCAKPNCDCKNKKLQNLYCHGCATKRFSKY